MTKACVVVGTQWGDEGKGKVTDYLASKADIVVRYQGGDNAGHSIEFNGKRYGLHLIPSGVFNEQIMCVIGNGVVFNPKSFLTELEALQKEGIGCKNILISDRAHIIFDYHKMLDGLEESKLGNNKIGTTKKGIGPTYTDKMARKGIRVGDFVSEDFSDLYRARCAEKNRYLASYDEPLIDVEASLNEYLEIAKKIKPYVGDSVTYLNESIRNGKKLLFEGAQGALLDIDFGTYPFVTSSNPSGGGICAGSGIGPTFIGEIVGVVKAYSTRVGSGAFPTEFEDEISNYIREKGHEYGVTTKRPRRIGWFDGVILRYSAMINGLTSLSIMLLDVLSDLDELKICVSYNLDGKVIHTVPSRIEDFNRCTPNYITLPGFKGDITGVKTYDELPVNAKNYLKKIEEIVGVPVSIVSVGPDRSQTIPLKEFYKGE